MMQICAGFQRGNALSAAHVLLARLWQRLYRSRTFEIRFQIREG
jgi:hypothetical protein